MTIIILNQITGNEIHNSITIPLYTVVELIDYNFSLTIVTNTYASYKINFQNKVYMLAYLSLIRDEMIKESHIIIDIESNTIIKIDTKYNINHTIN